ncbi:MAG: hypothetical protein MJE66_04745 [Proteobacteria bacterium]|nr:hypothetical protein [Pseudomonadota bacterium]
MPPESDTTETGGTPIDVYGSEGLLYSGEAWVQALDDDEYDWEVEFRVPNTQVAQFQMRRGERVSIALEEGAPRTPAYVHRFRLESGASASGVGGFGRIRLVGSGPAPAG